MKKTVCVYTCVYGAYEKTLPTHNVEAHEKYDFDFICFTDNDSHPKNDVGFWRIVQHSPTAAQDSTYKAGPLRVMYDVVLARGQPTKMPLLDQYDILIYIDANITLIYSKLLGDILDLAEKRDVPPLVAFSSHFGRTCAFKEAEYCLQIPKFSNTDLNGQVACYRANGMPEDAGLFWNGFMILFSPRDARMQPFYDRYSTEMMGYVKDNSKPYHAQGQVGLSYALWQCGWLLPNQEHFGVIFPLYSGLYFSGMIRIGMHN
jgi:hypothetical protein